MKKQFLFATAFICLSIALYAFAKPLQLTASANGVAKTETDSLVINTTATEATATEKSMSSMLYETLRLQEAGLSIEVLDYALKGYQKLLEEGKIQNSRYLSIVDFSQSSRKNRFYLLDLENNTLVKNTFVAHGKNSGIDKAEKFSNIPESEQSSLGFYITKATYTGKHGLSLKLSGVEEGFNNNAESRAIVVHGAEYVNKGRVNSAFMGRSQGCPALPEAEAAEVIQQIKGGSPLFIYHPSQNYLKHSPVLNS